jgi:hypothetical protein
MVRVQAPRPLHPVAEPESEEEDALEREFFLRVRGTGRTAPPWVY